MSPFPELRFPPIHPRIRRQRGCNEIWDELRGIYLVLTPEEWVRRHLIAYLSSDCGVLPLRIAQEYPVPLNGQAQRADVVVVDEAGQPLVLAECKAPDVAIDRKVWAQALRYNSVLQARYVILTNGMEHYCYRHDRGNYAPLASFPRL